MYSLFAPLWHSNDTLRKLLKEVLGYTDDEIKQMESESFGRNIVNNLTLDQAKDITKIFNDNNFQMYLNDGRGSDGIIFWNELGIDWIDEDPKDHYCDEPLVSRDYLADLSIQKKIDPPIKQTLFDTKQTVECPYCHSTNTRKITTTSKVVNTAVWGIFGTKRHKEWHCNKCNSDF